MTIRRALLGVLRRRRYRLRWTLDKLAQETGLDEGTLSRALSGKPGCGSMATLEAMAQAMGVDLEIIEGLQDVDTEPGLD